MKKNFTIVCRGSWLSLSQAEIFKEKVLRHFPALTLNVRIKETTGDRNQLMPLHLVEGKDFFTKEIQDALLSGEADFALHSMKDVSSEAFFQDGHFAIIERNNLHDVAIFNEHVIKKLQNKEEIIIGTSSPRRSNMATDFLQKALPVFSKDKINITVHPIRGNVDSRLKKLDDGLYDGVILAAAGLNRLLSYEPSRQVVSALLSEKRIMVLPLFECPPAAGQGAIVAETAAGNADALAILKVVEDRQLTKAISAERVYAQRYGYGCSQQFGVFHLDLPKTSFTYAAGKDDEREFVEWDFNIPGNISEKKKFSAAKYMKDFFNYDLLDNILIEDSEKVFFIASHRACHSMAIKNKLADKTVWAAGTRTWLELAKRGIWVQGCADGIGLEWALQIMGSQLLGIAKTNITILTNTDSANEWIKDGWKATGTYKLKPVFVQDIANEIAGAEILFWTSFQQYQLYRAFVSKEAQHCCPAGKTAALLEKEGIEPIVFPGIKAFNEWISRHTIVTSEG